MGGFLSADRPIINNQEGKTMAGYRKGVDESNKEPKEAKAGAEKGQLSAKEHFGKGGGKKHGKKAHSRHSSRK